MSIILRTLKGQALTYEEMDRNMSQFFYSSSLHSDGTFLRLWYTGSNSLDLPGEDYGPRYQQIQINTGDIEIPEATAAGDNTQIQYNNLGVFGAKSTFVFDYNKNNVGIGLSNPQAKLDISGETSRAAEITLRGFASTGNGILSLVSFNNGSTNLGKIGRKETTNSDIYLSALNSNKIKFEVGAGTTVGTVNGTGLGIGTETPNQKLSVINGSGLGIGIGRILGQQTKIRPLPNTIPGNVNGSGTRRLFPIGAETEGLLIESPPTSEGGSIIVALNTDSSENEGFNIIKARQGDFTSTTNTGVVATFRADGKVGINTNTPQDIGLTIAGNISGSGTLQVGTIDTGTANNTSALVATTSGLVQKIAAAPVPLGGIIMWSGAIGDIPDGWELCDGSNGTPDLTDRFVVGAGDTYAVGATGGSADAVLVAHNHTGTTDFEPNHIHPFPNTLYTKEGGSGDDNTFTNKDNTGKVDVTQTSPAGGHSHELVINSTGKRADGTDNPSQTGENANLPPYYALAFIMYVGS